MKNIWIDGYEANVLNRVGSGQFAYQLIKHLEKLDHHNNYTIFLPQEPLVDLPKPRANWQYKVCKPAKFWTTFTLPLQILKAKIKPDVFYSPTHYIPRFTKVKRVVTVFDVGYLRFPQTLNKKDLYKLTHWTKYSINNARAIITISKYSKKDIIKAYKINKDKIFVAYPGFDSSVYKKIDDPVKIKQVVQKYGLDGTYLIFIGTIQPRKNLARLIEAFKGVEGVSLAIVGKSQGAGREGWKFEEILNKPRELGIEKRVVFTGFVPNEDLVYLLNGAKALILPSLYEGFGIPLVDSFACGVPVIASNISSLPEVVGGAGVLIDPYRLSQIEQSVRLMVSDKKLQAKLAKISLQRSKLFSWTKCARIVLKVLEKT